MNIIGIICEYNPFHNGHIYHLQKIKEMYPDSLIILVLNGYFLERGEISLLSKENKTKVALENNIDIVLELPFVFGCQSADKFASISMQMLESFKCDYVIFGSESNDISKLEHIADYTLKNSEEYNSLVKSYLDKGLNYPTALAKALKIDFDFTPNDLLGISYVKAIKENNYHIKPLTIKRTNDYKDTTLNSDIVSASNIRERIKSNKSIKKMVPGITLKYLENISLDNLFPYLKYKIITDNNLDDYLDVEEGIQNRLKKIIYDCFNMDDLINKTKSKRYTYNRLRRMFIHILIGLKKEDIKNLNLEYIKVLGFNTNGKKYLNKIKKEIDISLTPLKDSLTYTYELKCASIYDLVSKNKALEFELHNKPINK